MDENKIFICQLWRNAIPLIYAVERGTTSDSGHPDNWTKIFHCPMISGASDWANQPTSERREARRRSEQCGASKRVSGVSERASGWASSPLTSPFQDILNHCVVVEKHERLTWTYAHVYLGRPQESSSYVGVSQGPHSGFDGTGWVWFLHFCTNIWRDPNSQAVSLEQYWQFPSWEQSLSLSHSMTSCCQRQEVLPQLHSSSSVTESWHLLHDGVLSAGQAVKYGDMKS